MARGEPILESLEVKWFSRMMPIYRFYPWWWSKTA